MLGVGIGAPTSFLSHFTVFVLACFVGYQVIWNVSPALHTPLMSVTNAISGIIILGIMIILDKVQSRNRKFFRGLADYISMLAKKIGYNGTLKAAWALQTLVENYA